MQYIRCANPSTNASRFPREAYPGRAPVATIYISTASRRHTCSIIFSGVSSRAPARASPYINGSRDEHPKPTAPTQRLIYSKAHDTAIAVAMGPWVLQRRACGSRSIRNTGRCSHLGLGKRLLDLVHDVLTRRALVFCVHLLHSERFVPTFPTARGAHSKACHKIVRDIAGVGCSVGL